MFAVRESGQVDGQRWSKLRPNFKFEGRQATSAGAWTTYSSGITLFLPVTSTTFTYIASHFLSSHASLVPTTCASFYFIYMLRSSLAP